MGPQLEDPHTLTPDEVTSILLDESNYGQHGSFLSAFFDTWFKADVFNKMILYESALRLINKYNLHRRTSQDAI